MITEQVDESIPVRSLTPLEKRVEEAALRAIQQYLLGEMDFAEPTPPASERRDDDEGRAAETSGSSG